MRKYYLIFFLFFFSCSSSKNTEFRGWAMTMPYHIIIAKNLSENQQKAVLDVIQKTFEETDLHFNSFNLDSEISQINQDPVSTDFLLSQKLYLLLKLCEKYHIFTQGHFDPTIGSVYSLWKKAFEKKKFIDPSQIKQYNKSVGWANIKLEKKMLKKAFSFCKIDLNGIAKGYTIDRLAQRIQKLGYKNIFVEWGGDVMVLGKASAKRSWKVQVLSPQITKIASLQNQACATSGSFKMFYWKDQAKKSYLPIFDPFTKCPREVSSKSFNHVTVFAPNCTQADALATAALTFSEKKAALKWAENIVKEKPNISFWFFQEDKNAKIIKVQ